MNEPSTHRLFRPLESVVDLGFAPPHTLKHRCPSSHHHALYDHHHRRHLHHRHRRHHPTTRVCVFSDNVALRRFRIRSCTHHKLRITLRSDLHTRLGFQLENANIEDDKENNADDNVANPLNRTQSQMLNFVGLVDSVELMPMTTLSIVLGLRPRRSFHDGFHPQNSSDRGYGMYAVGNVVSSKSTSHLSSFSLTGYIFLTGTVIEPVPRGVPSLSMGAQSDDLRPDPDEDSSDNQVQINGQRRRSHAIVQSIEAQRSLRSRIQSDPTDASFRNAEMQQECVVQLRARLSIGRLELTTQKLTFKDCIVRRSYTREFLLANRGELRVPFCISLRGPRGSDDSLMSFHDADTNEHINTDLAPQYVLPYAHRRIRVTFTPIDAGHTDHVVDIDNLYGDAGDKEQVLSIHVVAVCVDTATEEQDWVHFPYVDGLSFNECYTGVPKAQVLTVRNPNQSVLDLQLSSDLDNEQVWFGLLAEGARSSEVLTNRNGQDPLNDADAVQDLDAMDAKKSRRENLIEEVSVNAGGQRRIVVWFCPRRSPGVTDEDACKSLPVSFNVYVKRRGGPGSKSEKSHTKIVDVTARVSTSLTSLSQSKIDFGSCQVGAPKTMQLTINNQSDVPARIAVQLWSKSITCKSNPDNFVFVPANRSVDIQFRYLPRSPNPNYHKEMTIVNLNNEADRKIVEFVAHTTPDHKRLLRHTQYYNVAVGSGNLAYDRVLSEDGAVDFGQFIAGTASLRKLTLSNVAPKDIILAVLSSSPEIRIFRRAKGFSHGLLRPFMGTQNKERLMEDMKGRLGAMKPKTKGSTIDYDGGAVSKLSQLLSFDLAVAHGQAGAAAKPAPGTATKPTAAGDGVSKVEVSPPTSPPSQRRSTGGQGSAREVKSSEDLKAIRSNVETKFSHGDRGTTEQFDVDRVLAAIVALYERHTQPPPPFEHVSAEQQYVDERKEVAKVLEELIAIEALAEIKPESMVNIRKGAEISLYVLFEPPEQPLAAPDSDTMPSGTGKPSGKLRKRYGELFLRYVQRGVTLPQVTPTPKSTPEAPHLALHSPEVFALNPADRSPVGTPGSSPVGSSSIASFNGSVTDERQHPRWEDTTAAEVMGIPLRASVCSQPIKLSHININFGRIESAGDKVSRTFEVEVQNTAEVPLVYAVKMSGKINNLDLHVAQSHRKGLVRPFGSKRVQIEFRPKLAGMFEEQIEFVNLSAQHHTRSVKVRADFHKKAVFDISPEQLSFGITAPSVRSPHVSLAITNNSKQERTFRVETREGRTGSGHNTPVYFILDKSRRNAGDDKDTEIERLEQLLKKYKRKKKEKKAAAVVAKIKILRGDDDADENGSPDGAWRSDMSLSSTSGDSASDNDSKGIGVGGADGSKRVHQKGITFSLAGSSSQKLSVFVVPHPPLGDDADRIQGHLAAFEVKLPNVLREIPWSCEVPPTATLPLQVRPWMHTTRKLTGNHLLDAYVSKDSGGDVLTLSAGMDSDGQPNVQRIHIVNRLKEETTVLFRWASARGEKKQLPRPSHRESQHDSGREQSEGPRVLFKDLRSSSNVVGNREWMRSVQVRLAASSDAIMGCWASTSGKAQGDQTSSAAEGSIMVVPLAMPDSVLKLPCYLGAALTITPSMIDCGDVDVRQPYKSHFTIANRLPAALNFVIMTRENADSHPGSKAKDAPSSSSETRRNHSILKLSAHNGKVDENGTVSIDFTVTPLRKGVQRHVVVVRDLRKGHEIKAMIQLKGKNRGSLSFPTVNPTDGKMHLGMCHLLPTSTHTQQPVSPGLKGRSHAKGSPKTTPIQTDATTLPAGSDKATSSESGSGRYSKVVPFVVRNNNKEPVLFSARSNLPTQVKIFADHPCMLPAEGLRVGAQAEVQVFVAVRPIQTAASSMERREIVGGLLFKEYLDDDGEEHIEHEGTRGGVFEHSVKFTFTVGRAELVVSPQVIDLGVIQDKPGSVLNGSFTVAQLSSADVPRQYDVQAGPNVIIESKQAQDNVRDEVCFRVVPDRCGRLETWVLVRNLNLVDAATTIQVLAMVESGKVSFSNIAKTEMGYWMLTLGPVYVSPISDTTFVNLSDPNKPQNTSRIICSVSPHTEPFSMVPLILNDSVACLDVTCDPIASEEQSALTAETPLSAKGTTAESVPLLPEVNSGLHDAGVVAVDGWDSCGPIISFSEQYPARDLHVRLSGPVQTNEEQIRLLHEGSLVPITFTMALGGLSGGGAAVLETLVMVTAELCISNLTLLSEPVIDLGQLQRTNPPVPFSIKLRNPTGAPALWHLQLPKGIIGSCTKESNSSTPTKESEIEGIIETGSTSSVELEVRSDQIAEDGDLSCELLVQNVCAPDNVLVVRVEGFVESLCGLLFSDLFDDNTLRLPTTTVSSFASKGQRANFAVTNPSDSHTMLVYLTCQSAEDLQGVVRLDASLGHTNVIPTNESKSDQGPVVKLSLEPNLTTFVSVELKVIDETSVDALVTKQSDMVCMGSVVLTTNFVHERRSSLANGRQEVPVWACIKKNQARLSVSTANIHFPSDTGTHTNTFEVHNDSAAQVTLEARVVLSDDAAKAMRVQVSCGDHTLMPYSSVAVTVQADVFHLYSGKLRLLLSDGTGVGVPLTVELVFPPNVVTTPSMGAIMGDIDVEDLLLDNSIGPKEPRLVIKGCQAQPKTDSQYFLYCGRQHIQSKPSVWHLKLCHTDSTNSQPIDWQVRCIGDDVDSWLTLTKPAVPLEMNQQQELELTCSPLRLGSFSAYVLIEEGNVNLATILVNVEVITQVGGTDGAKIFEVEVEGGEWGREKQIFDMGDVYEGQHIACGWLIVRNLTDTATKFKLECTNETGNSGGESELDGARAERADRRNGKPSMVLLSETDQAQSCIDRLMVGPRSTRRVHVRLFVGQLEDTDNMDVSTCRLYRQERVQIRVTCRLIRDCVSTAGVRAICRRSRLALDRRELLFHVKGTPARSKVRPRNLQGIGILDHVRAGSVRCEPAEVDHAVVKGKMSQVTVQTLGECFFRHVVNEVAQGVTHVVMVPEIEAITTHWAALARQGFAEERVRIYCASNPREMYVVRARLTLHPDVLIVHWPMLQSQRRQKQVALESMILGLSAEERNVGRTEQNRVILRLAHACEELGDYMTDWVVGEPPLVQLLMKLVADLELVERFGERSLWPLRRLVRMYRFHVGLTGGDLLASLT